MLTILLPAALYQANGSLPAACDCAYGPIRLGLPRFTHGVVRHDAASLSAETLALIDAHSQVRKLLGRRTCFLLTLLKVKPYLLHHLLLGRRAALCRGAAPAARQAAHRRGAHRCRAAPLHRLAQALAGVGSHPRAVELAQRVRRVAHKRQTLPRFKRQKGAKSTRPQKQTKLDPGQKRAIW